MPSGRTIPGRVSSAPVSRIAFSIMKSRYLKIARIMTSEETVRAVSRPASLSEPLSAAIPIPMAPAQTVIISRSITARNLGSPQA